MVRLVPRRLGRLLGRRHLSAATADASEPGTGACCFPPRDAGLVSNVNFVAGTIMAGREVFPLFSAAALPPGTMLRQFPYLDAVQENAWFAFFAPLVYRDGDPRHHDSALLMQLPRSQGLAADPVFRVPAATRALYARPDFPEWRKRTHATLGPLLRPAPAVASAVETMLADLPAPRIGVHVRHPSHGVEQGLVLFADYFGAIDRLLDETPDASLFLATDTELALAAFRLRYGTRVRWQAEAVRSSIDDLLVWADAAARGTVDAMGFVDGVGHQTHYRLAAAGGGADGIRAGVEAATDLFTLARCDSFVCTLSNFTLACSYLNPDQRQILVAWRMV
ncbi:hypothetical protein PQJ75_19970 [Rhodoplanes sp. TEM]|uniref:Nodulation protein NodH n=1 Tax=Rhodoplanes tepidamans TaxID=200616 RepID=A0ABT5JII0_RHOTP|nr:MULTISPECIES: hypothetical protein [Rhodoplanes]MDC7789323.1 hypothetical protein [Rhodoplanes tepidamans]MDC7986012.1 hypothetical protein [Rhodoplanes sp. TEM]MDQ0358998.1 hypothetical protein [Rhodoplanes tepidamans]